MEGGREERGKGRVRKVTKSGAVHILYCKITNS